MEAGGGCRESIARVDVYIKDLKDFGVINEAYKEFFGEHKPTRVCVQVAALRGMCRLRHPWLPLQGNRDG